MAESYIELEDLANMSLDQLTSSVLKSISKIQKRNKDLKIPPFDGEESYKVIDFIEEYEERDRCNDWSNSDLFNHFALYLTGNAKSWHKLTMQANDSPPTTWCSLKELFIQQYMPKDKKRYFRTLIQERKQKYSESVLQYIIDIRSLCYQMDDETSESDIIDHLFDGLLPSFKREFELNKCQTIDEFTEFARKIEQANSHYSVRKTENKQETKFNEELEALKSEISSKFYSFMRFLEIQIQENSNESPSRQPSIDNELVDDINEINENADSNSEIHPYFYHGEIRNSPVNYPIETNVLDNNYDLTESECRQSFSDEEQFEQTVDNCIRGMENISLIEQQNFQYNVREQLVIEQSLNCEYEGHSEERDFFCDEKTIHVINSGKPFNELLFRNFQVKNVEIKCLLDTGSELSVIDLDLWEKLNNSINPYTGFPIRAANYTNIEAIGVTYLPIKPSSTADLIEIRCVVVRGLGIPLILGNDFHFQSGIIINFGDKTISFVRENPTRKIKSKKPKSSKEANRKRAESLKAIEIQN